MRPRRPIKFNTPATGPAPVMNARVRRIFEETIRTDHRVITEDVSKSILRSYGISVPRHALATTPEEAARGA